MNAITQVKAPSLTERVDEVRQVEDGQLRVDGTLSE
jgi:hypothetical protein